MSQGQNLTSLKVRAEFGAIMAECAALGDFARVDLEWLLPPASQHRLRALLNSLDAKEGVDYQIKRRARTLGRGDGYNFWFTDSFALRLIPLWSTAVSESIAKQLTEERIQRAVLIIQEYAERYPISTPKEIEELVKNDGIMDQLQKILEKIDEHGIGIRKPFPPETVRLYAQFLAERRSGRCPISHKLIADSNGTLLSGAEVDHFYSRSYVGINGGWIIISEENKKLRDPAYRASINTRFLTFQEELKQWMTDRNGEEMNLGFN